MRDWNEIADAVRDLAKQRDLLVVQNLQLQVEVDAMKAEREPRDNGDGTVTQLLPVTYRDKWKGRTMACGQPKRDQAYVSNHGQELTNSVSKFDRDDFRLILSPPEPAKPEPVTWASPLSLPSGRYEWEQARTRLFRLGEQRVAHTWADYCPSESYSDWTDPPKDGIWHVDSGVGTLQVDQ
jgi:hypothetical protein